MPYLSKSVGLDPYDIFREDMITLKGYNGFCEYSFDTVLIWSVYSAVEFVALSVGSSKH